jgi:hypothetical protein
MPNPVKKKRSRKLRDQNLVVMRKMKSNKVESKKKYKRRWHCEECEIESKWGKNG